METTKRPNWKKIIWIAVIALLIISVLIVAWVETYWYYLDKTFFRDWNMNKEDVVKTILEINPDNGPELIANGRYIIRLYITDEMHEKIKNGEVSTEIFENKNIVSMEYDRSGWVYPPENPPQGLYRLELSRNSKRLAQKTVLELQQLSFVGEIFYEFCVSYKS